MPFVLEIASAKSGHPVLPIFDQEQADSGPKVQKCATCRVIKRLEEFPYKRESAGWRQRRCKECAAAAIRKSRAITRSAPDPGGHPCAHCKEPCPPATVAGPPRKFCSRSCAVSDNQKQQPARLRKRVLAGYGLTLEAYDEMVTKQDGCCAICKTFEPLTRTGVWPIDHCHETGRVRALLCNSCNLGLGAFRDDPDRLRAAAEYVERHKTMLARSA